MAQITINGKTYSGKNLVIRNGNVSIDGSNISIPEQDKVINISVEGNIDSLTTSSANRIGVIGNINTHLSGSGDITVQGNVGSIQTGSGDVKCNDVQGMIRTGSGDVYCQSNSGNIHM